MDHLRRAFRRVGRYFNSDPNLQWEKVTLRQMDAGGVRTHRRPRSRIRDSDDADGGVGAAVSVVAFVGVIAVALALYLLIRTFILILLVALSGAAIIYMLTGDTDG